MKCDQCNMVQITMGGISQPCHETGCPNSKKVWDVEDGTWVEPEPEEDDDDYFPWDDDDEWDDDDDY